MRDEGLMHFYDLVNTSAPAAKPVDKLVDLGITAYYAKKQIGIQRMYAAKGANIKLDKLVRAYTTSLPEEAKYVILEDGQQYRIIGAVEVVDLDALDLELERLGTYYEVVE